MNYPVLKRLGKPKGEVQVRSPAGASMAKKNSVTLPDWAKSMWEDMGSPKLEDLKSVHTGDLLERRQGLRRDDLVELHLNVQAFANPEDAYIRGRLISWKDKPRNPHR